MNRKGDREMNLTQLVFCRENVDPDFVTRQLGLIPTESLRVGDETTIGGRPGFLSRVGLWKLSLPNESGERTIEEQLAQWTGLLQSRVQVLRELREAGYSPYLDCRAERGSQSLCIDPAILAALGTLSVSLSIWLYEGQ